MSRRICLLCLCLSLCALLAAPLLPAVCAQDSAHGWTDYDVNLRTGPEVTHQVLTILPANTGLVFEARNADASWLLGHTTDGLHRGWVASLYLHFADGFHPPSLPLSDEIMPPPPPVATPRPAGQVVAFDPAATGALDTLPVLPVFGPRVYTIFQTGRAVGNNPRVFAKVGDCNAYSGAFMGFLGSGRYTLGEYAALLPTISFFSVSPAPGIANSFSNESAATHSGYTAQAVLDPMWSDPGLCPANRSPLECEYERIHPSVALIMFGLSDSHHIGAAEYEQAMRQIIEISIARGVIPVLTTFPTWAGEVDEGMRNKRLAMNNALVSLADEYGVPLLNLWRAAQALPFSGLDGDLLHISYNGVAWLSFEGDEQQWGFTVWNLVALQLLDQLRNQVLSG